MNGTSEKVRTIRREVYCNMRICILNSIIEEIEETCKGSTREQGFILGCSKRYGYVDMCQSIQGSATEYEYIPDIDYTNAVIDEWRRRGICFCGMIHSHLILKTLSSGDYAAVQSWTKSVALPFLVFGVIVDGSESANIRIYVSSTKKGEVRVQRLRRIRPIIPSQWVKWGH